MSCLLNRLLQDHTQSYEQNQVFDRNYHSRNTLLASHLTGMQSQKIITSRQANSTQMLFERLCTASFVLHVLQILALTQ
jgi:hypothetical protein